ncbi:MAG: multicopper oxidase domain-containing protein [Gammaproteobacteria bacterium]|nr:multicopper oxidase domain-containing protein [Gammaproteobacteria bacterium]MDH5213430.1 multicopper oxidase domain-containing protein [Gammaproteobacteria bacterium]
MKIRKSLLLLIAAIAIGALSYPPQWYPMPLRLQLTRWFGAADYRPLPLSMDPQVLDAETFCPEDASGWREAQVIDGVSVTRSAPCVADNPYAVAAFVKGTNNVSKDTLLRSGLTSDAVEKGRDLDGDGDPDEIHIRLEVAELNGGSSVTQRPVTSYDIAPGIQPGMWVFAPKLVGMAVENFETGIARDALRLPSPAIRVEQGDSITITLENSHYMPHTLHLHGADHGFVDSSGEGNDGVPITSEIPVMPGHARSYELQPRHAGTMFYHCHVQPHVHVLMGLQGLFVVEENRPNNWLQTMNVGAGLVRAPSAAVRESYDQEYDLHYLDLDKDLGERIRKYRDPRLITQSMHREYDITDADVDFFTLNGRSFPYTFRESLLVAAEGERLKLRVVNGGAKGISLHTHGHKFSVTDRDGVRLSPATVVPQDVVWIPTAQRVDLDLFLTNDGLHSYGRGIWLYHDHQNKGVTNDGIGPGGNISAIVYADYIDDSGWPKTQGVPWNQYFTKEYYRKEIPIWESYAPGLFSNTVSDPWWYPRLAGMALALAMLAALSIAALRRRSS